MNTFFIGSDDQYYKKGTLAHFLDQRDVSYGEPSASNLPSEINPFDLVRKNVFQNRLILIRLDYSNEDEVPFFKYLDRILKFCVPVDSFPILWIKMPVFYEIPQTVISETVADPLKVALTATDTMSLNSAESYSISKLS